MDKYTQELEDILTQPVNISVATYAAKTADISVPDPHLVNIDCLWQEGELVEDKLDD